MAKRSRGYRKSSGSRGYSRRRSRGSRSRRRASTGRGSNRQTVRIVIEQPQTSRPGVIGPDGQVMMPAPNPGKAQF